MNALYKLYCRCFQKVMYVAMFFLPWRVPEQISGEGSLAKLPAFAKKKGWKSALLVTDQGLMSLGMAQPIIDGFKAEGLNITVYDKVIPNPTITNIEEGLKLYNDNKCDVIIALGGGSPMDCAKGIGARVARPGKPIPKMKGILRVMKKLPPLVAIPTTSGTGSEATLAAVISNPDTHEKYPINDPVLIPHYAVMDPLLTVGLPKHITSTTGMDALTHAVEAYIGGENTSNTKKYAMRTSAMSTRWRTPSAASTACLTGLPTPSSSPTSSTRTARVRIRNSLSSRTPSASRATATRRKPKPSSKPSRI